MKTKHPVHIKRFGAVTSDGDVIPLLIFSQGLRLNTEADINYLKEVVMLWIERVAAERPPNLATGLCTMPHKQESSVFAAMKFLRLHHH